FEVGGDDFLDQALFKLRIEDGKHALNAAEEIAAHPVGAADVHFRLVAGVLEVINAAVLQEAAHDAAHPDVLAHPLDAGHEAANAADDQVDLHACSGGGVEVIDGLLFNEAVTFGDDARWLAGLGV